VTKNHGKIRIMANDTGITSPATGSQAPDHALRFAGAVILAIVVFAGFLVALGVRLDNQDLTPTEATTSETQRQELAVTAAKISHTAQALASGKSSGLYSSVGHAAELYLDALGGVWIPWPSGAPSGYTNPPLATSAPSDATGVALVTSLTDFSADALSAADDATEDTRPTYMAIALSARLYARDLAEALGTDDPGCPAVTATAAGSALGDSTTVEIADTARQWLEFDAASLPVGQRQAQLDRIASLSAFEDAAIAAGASDSRKASAPLPDNSAQSLTTQALSLFADRIAYASAITDSKGRAALFGYTCSLFLSSQERESVLPLLTDN
jgi:hypothetical protein